MQTLLLSYPDFGGHRYSRSSSDWTVDNTVRLPGLLSAQLTRKLTPGKSWGSRSKPQTRTRGKFEPDAKVKMFLEDYNVLVAYLTTKAAAQGFGIFEVSWQLTGTLFEPTLGVTRWDVRGTRIVSEDITPTEDGDDKEVEVSLDLDVMDILKDGLSVVNEQSPFGQVGQNL